MMLQSGDGGASSSKMAGSTRWLLDGAASVCAAKSEQGMYDISACKVYVRGIGGGLWVTKKGSFKLRSFNADKNIYCNVILKNVLIHSDFPANIISEPVFLRKGCTIGKAGPVATMCSPNGGWMLEARTCSKDGLFFVVESPEHHATSLGDEEKLLIAEAVSDSKALEDALPFVREAEEDKEGWAAIAPNVIKRELGAKENLCSLLEGHLRLHHRNFEDVARILGLKLPNPPPKCLTCALGKPRLLSHDKISSRLLTRRGQGFSADYKPFSVATPEGDTCWLLLQCLYSSYRWTFLCKSQGDFVQVWKVFVLTVETHVGQQNVIAFLLADNANTFGSGDKGSLELKNFCAEKGIRLEFSPPHGQWANVVERQNQTVFNGALCDMIHGGATGTHEYFWGWAARGSTQGSNRVFPARPPAGRDGETCKEIWDGYRQPMALQLRCQWPFLCLAITLPPTNTGEQIFNQEELLR